MATKKKNIRHTNSRLEKLTRDRIKARGDVCAICGKPIDYSLRRPDPMAFQVDHIIPIARGGALYDIDNLQATHAICNQRKGGSIEEERTTVQLSRPTSMDFWHQ